MVCVQYSARHSIQYDEDRGITDIRFVSNKLACRRDDFTDCYNMLKTMRLYTYNQGRIHGIYNRLMKSLTVARVQQTIQFAMEMMKINVKMMKGVLSGEESWSSNVFAVELRFCGGISWIIWNSASDPLDCAKDSPGLAEDFRCTLAYLENLSAGKIWKYVGIDY